MLPSYFLEKEYAGKSVYLLPFPSAGPNMLLCTFRAKVLNFFLNTISHEQFGKVIFYFFHPFFSSTAINFDRGTVRVVVF